MINFYGMKNKYENKTFDDVFNILDEICDKEKSFTDSELADELSEISKFCTGGNKEKGFYLITHMRKENLVKKRAKKYCKKNKISLEDYDGPLPYSKYIIPLHDPVLERRKKINKILGKEGKRKTPFEYFKRLISRKK